MTSPESLAVPLDDLACLVECVALDYTGELKTELWRLCENIRRGASGYEAQIVQSSLEELDSYLDAYRTDRKREGTSGLIRISRRWWAAARSADAP